VSGDLSAGDAAAIGDHLEGCTFCRSEAAAFGRCEQALGVLSAVQEAPDLSEDLRRRIATPLPWRPRWGVAAAVAGVALAVTAIAMVLAGPQKAPAPSVPIVRENVTRQPVVSMPQAPDVTVAIPAETSVSPHSPPVIVSAPRPVPAEVVLEQATIPAVVSVPGQGQPAGLAEVGAIEAGPVMASLTTQPERAGGVVLLLGRPKPAQHASSCYLEVSLPNGARSVFERTAKLEPAGAPRVIKISYEEIAPERPAAEQGG
jgi:hypothetical protein